jgi:hypothetical protein
LFATSDNGDQAFRLLSNHVSVELDQQVTFADPLPFRHPNLIRKRKPDQGRRQVDNGSGQGKTEYEIHEAYNFIYQLRAFDASLES